MTDASTVKLSAPPPVLTDRLATVAIAFAVATPSIATTMSFSLTATPMVCASLPVTAIVHADGGGARPDAVFVAGLGVETGVVVAGAAGAAGASADCPFAGVAGALPDEDGVPVPAAVALGWTCAVDGDADAEPGAAAPFVVAVTTAGVGAPAVVAVVAGSRVPGLPVDDATVATAVVGAVGVAAVWGGSATSNCSSGTS
jgi:hypothetical protein